MWSRNDQVNNFVSADATNVRRGICHRGEDFLTKTYQIRMVRKSSTKCTLKPRLALELLVG